MGAVPAIMIAAQVAQGYLQGVAARRAAQASAQALDRNALIARENAGYVQQVGQQKAGAARDAAVRLIAKSQVIAAAGGVTLDSGSLSDIVAGSWTNAEVHTQTLLNDAWRKAWGLETQADTMEYQARQTRAEGDAAMFSALLGGAAGGAKTAVGAMGDSPPPPPGHEGLLYGPVGD